MASSMLFRKNHWVVANWCPGPACPSPASPPRTKLPEPSRTSPTLHSWPPRNVLSLIPPLPAQTLQVPQRCPTVPSPRKPSLILQLVDASSRFCQLTRCPLFLAPLPPDEPDTRVVMNILAAPCQSGSTPSSSRSTTEGLTGP